ncbi:MAG: outer membrane lipoprotein carrier protein LolA [Deltaproteobacteria bacterium]|nr:outer membrane lipoprotein carrier protein LolA [Candidatus Tharpella aukensis]
MCRVVTLFCLLLGLFSGCLSSPVGAVEREADSVKIEAENLLEPTLQRIREAAAGVETITSTMVQEKYLKAFAEVLKARGNFAFHRPDCWRWELVEPVLSGLSVCGINGRRWHEKGGKAQSFKLADEPWLRHFATQVTAWTTADFAFLQKEYILTLLDSELNPQLSPELNSEPPSLKLVPREVAARRLVASLEITFSADYRYVTRIVIREADGDYTAINFLDVIINQPLPEESFK